MSAVHNTGAGRRIILVTGASSGIGRATARTFAARGDWVVLAGRRVEELEATLAACGGPEAGRVQQCDVTDRAQVRALAASVAEREGACHVLVNNAGIGARTPFDGPAAMEAFDRVLATNLGGAAACTAELLPLLRASAPASIVNVSSVAGLVGMPGSPSYCASKWGLTGFSESLHAALAQHGVHVAAVHPGPVPTPGWPHAKLRARWWSRPLVADADAIARTIVRCADRRGTPMPVRPRVFALVPVLRTLAPWLTRALLRRAALRRLEPLPHEVTTP